MEEKIERNMEGKKRTEEQKIFQEEISIILGGKEYRIRPLVIKESRKWRAKVVKIMGNLPQYMSITSDTPDEFREAIDVLLVAMPDKVIDLVLDYSPKLKADREFIENNATDPEMSKAFKQIAEVAFPLVKSLTGAMGNLAR